MKFLKVVLAICLLSSTSSAAESVGVVQCPATNGEVKAFRNKLKDLKAAIKNEANCEPIKADIAHLGDLLTKERPKFLDLIAQGQTEGLSEVEEGSVQTYVNDLTVTAYNLLAVVTGKDACFEEDKQGNSMQFLTSVIGEGAKLLAIAGGPELAPIISIAGEAITGFMSAMQSITSMGYDFNKNDQQIAYADNLCALFDTKRELTTMVYSAESIARLENLQVSLQKQVDTLAQKCPECAEIKGMVDAQFRAVAVDGAIEQTDQVWPSDFEKQVAEKAKAVDGLYTNPLGSNIYKQLKTLTWIPLRIAALRANEFNVDIVLASSIGELEEVEQFMIDDQARWYLDSLLRDAEENIWALNKKIEAATWVLSRNGGPQLPMFNMTSFYSGTYTDIQDFYGKLFSGLDKLERSTDSDDVRDDIQQFFNVLKEKSRYIDVQVDVMDKYCTFFQQSKWGWGKTSGSGIKEFCTDSYTNQIREQALLLANYRVLMEAGDGASLLLIQNVDAPAAAEVDWADAARENAEAQAADVNYVVRQAN